MGLKESLEKLKFDVRMLDINLKNQSVTQSDIATQMDRLSDLQGQAIPVDLENEADDGLNDQ